MEHFEAKEHSDEIEGIYKTIDTLINNHVERHKDRPDVVNIAIFLQAAACAVADMAAFIIVNAANKEEVKSMLLGGIESDIQKVIESNVFMAMDKGEAYVN